MSRIIIAFRGIARVLQPTESRLTIRFQPVRRLQVIYSSQTWITRNGLGLGSQRFSQPKREVVNRPLGLKKMPVEYPPLTGSEHWTRKMRTVFRALDSNNDGRLSSEDMILSGKRAAQYLGLNEDQTEAIVKLRLHICKTAIEKNPKGEMAEEVSFDAFIQNRILAFNDMKARQELFSRVIPVEFNTMDTDGDGKISPKEHAAYFHSLNIPTEHSKKIFDVMDTNKNGYISVKEFGEGHLDFWLGEDPNSKYNEFLGPLVD
ncbi:calcium-dependent protein kinase 4-like [Lingula anatina]|uniref:Calcium-dependent protein kinase 4-like n=1 Tax=Lingula anatina TaxID=7574 RepID=A0A1S3HQN4_LINAN|nr:calcium-dependent protein kinase 4-like [Lingula anatina]|eukprot:XP_013388350.2 calcium-dependent protein kinase 4-like [Lingula anatina]